MSMAMHGTVDVINYNLNCDFPYFNAYVRFKNSLYFEENKSNVIFNNSVYYNIYKKITQVRV